MTLPKLTAGNLATLRQQVAAGQRIDVGMRRLIQPEIPVAKAVSRTPRIPGRMNQTEQRYAQRLTARQRTGDIAAWVYEGMKLKLADKTWYTPDFVVILANGEMELHEIKGFMEDDSAVKIKVTSRIYWWFRILVVKEKPKHVWHLTEVTA